MDRVRPFTATYQRVHSSQCQRMISLCADWRSTGHPRRNTDAVLASPGVLSEYPEWSSPASHSAVLGTIQGYYSDIFFAGPHAPGKDRQRPRLNRSHLWSIYPAASPLPMPILTRNRNQTGIGFPRCRRTEVRTVSFQLSRTGLRSEKRIGGHSDLPQYLSSRRDSCHLWDTQRGQMN